MKLVYRPIWFLSLIIIGCLIAAHYSGIFKPTLRVRLYNHLPGSQKPIPFLHSILKEKYNVRYNKDENYDLIIDDVYDQEPISGKDTKAIKIFYSAEATLPDLDKYDLVLGYNRLEDPKYFRMPYYYRTFRDQIHAQDNMRRGKILFLKLLVPQKKPNCEPEAKKVFACFLVTNGTRGVNSYPGNGLPLDGVVARDEIFNKLSEYKHVESGGKHLNNIGKVVPIKETQKWLSRCKFVIAYENQSYDGYITEKVFQAYFAGSIPIYYSHPNAIWDINKKAVIYANDFSSKDDLVEYIKKVDNDDKLYCDIWRENIVTNPEINYESVYNKLREKIFRLLDEKLHK